MVKKGKLTILAGTDIEMDACGIICKGTLIVQGSKDKPVVFTGDAWDNISVLGGKAQFTYCEISGGSGIGVQQQGNNFIVTPQYLDITYGGGLMVGEKGTATMINCKIENAYGINMIAVIGSSLTMKNCLLREHSQQGIFSYDGKLTIQNSRFENHREAAISFSSVNVAQLENNTFSNCGVAVLKNRQVILSEKNNKFENCNKNIIDK